MFIFFLSREGGKRLRGDGKKLLARDFGRSQQRRSRSCSDVVMFLLLFRPRVRRGNGASLRKIHTDRFAYDLGTPQRAKLFDPKRFCLEPACIFSSLLCHGNSTSPPFILHRNYAHPLHPPRERTLSTPSSTHRWVSPSITTQFPK